MFYHFAFLTDLRHRFSIDPLQATCTRTTTGNPNCTNLTESIQQNFFKPHFSYYSKSNVLCYRTKFRACRTNLRLEERTFLSINQRKTYLSRHNFKYAKFLVEQVWLFRNGALFMRKYDSEYFLFATQTTSTSNLRPLLQFGAIIRDKDLILKIILKFFDIFEHFFGFHIPLNLTKY